MNCKPGDMAIVKRGLHGLTHAGKIVTVIGAMPDTLGLGAMWEVHFPRPILLINGVTGNRALCPDAWLMPISDPGDDATDEMLRITPSPVWELAHKVTT